MAHHREELWDEIYDMPIFRADHPAAARAWRWAEDLHGSGKLRNTDLLSLMGLIQACLDYSADS